jgi:DNA-directed RNA polymerase specialized sigma24 family protein
MAKFYRSFTNLPSAANVPLTNTPESSAMSDTLHADRSYVLHRSRLAAQARARGLGAHDAEDMVQDVFAALVRVGRLNEVNALPESDQAAVLNRRLTSMIANHWRNQHRQRRDQRRTICITEVDDIMLTATPATELDRKWALQAIDNALERLRVEITERQWQRVEPVLRGEVRSAAGAQVPSTKLRVAVHRARQHLRTLISQDAIQAALRAA